MIAGLSRVAAIFRGANGLVRGTHPTKNFCNRKGSCKMQPQALPRSAQVGKPVPPGFWANHLMAFRPQRRILQEPIAFARSSFLFFPLPPAGGEGRVRGAWKKLLPTGIRSILCSRLAAHRLLFVIRYIRGWGWEFEGGGRFFCKPSLAPALKGRAFPAAPRPGGAVKVSGPGGPEGVRPKAAGACRGWLAGRGGAPGGQSAPAGRLPPPGCP